HNPKYLHPYDLFPSNLSPYMFELLAGPSFQRKSHYNHSKVFGTPHIWNQNMKLFFPIFAVPLPLLQNCTIANTSSYHQSTHSLFVPINQNDSYNAHKMLIYSHQPMHKSL